MKFKLSHIRHIYNHPLAKKVRFKSFFRYTLFHAIYKNDDEVKIPFLEGKLIVKKGYGGQTNYFTFLEDYEEMLFLIHYLKRDDVFVDVGANIGSYSILAAMTNNLKVHAFEPNKVSYQILNKNILLNKLDGKIISYQCGLGKKNSKENIIEIGALSHIINEQDIASHEIKLRKLDDIIDTANLMKIDVEGYEENVLLGSKKILANSNLNAIIIEMAGYNRFGSSDEKVHGILSDYGFNPVFYDPLTRVLNHREEYSRHGKGWWNVIYVRDFDLATKKIKKSGKIKINGEFY